MRRSLETVLVGKAGTMMGLGFWSGGTISEGKGWHFSAAESPVVGVRGGLRPVAQGPFTLCPLEEQPLWPTLWHS